MTSVIVDKSQAVKRINEYSFARVEEKLIMEGKLAPHVMEEAITEFRKYLVLIALGHNRVGMCSKEVDEVWHTFILFTKDYTVFCLEVFGFFLHHEPALLSQPLGSEPRQRFLEAYNLEFGTPPKIWITNADCSPNTGGGGNECSPEPSCDGSPEPT